MNTEVKALRHTAGPWRVQCDPVWVGAHPLHDNRFITTDHELEIFEDRYGDKATRIADEGEIICKLTDSEHQAGNARLIAAAPELLELLKEIYDWTDYKDTVWARRTKAAINKAEGRA